MIGSKWRHKIRGTTYEVVFDTASLQCSSVPGFEELVEDEDWIVYRNNATGSVHVRMAKEFFDGRFELVEEAK